MAKLLLPVALLITSLALSAAKPDFPNTYAIFAKTPELAASKMAVDVAGLTQSLKDPKFVGTIFAPSNDAWGEFLLKFDLTTEELVSDTKSVEWLLKYHTIAGRVIAASSIPKAPKSFKPTTKNGQKLNIFRTGKTTAVQSFGSTGSVVKADITAPKAVVHVVNSVLISDGSANWPGCPSVAERLVKLGSFQTLLLVSTKAKLFDDIADKDFTGTILAPTDQAFAAALKKYKTSLQAMDQGIAEDVLLYHASPLALPARYLKNKMKVPTANNHTLTTIIKNGLFFKGSAGTAKVLATDFFACKAVIHIIDMVLIAKE